jgi:hypothetical protein
MSEQTHTCRDTTCYNYAPTGVEVCSIHPKRIGCPSFLRIRPPEAPCASEDQDRGCLECEETESCPLINWEQTS